ncbi:MAG: DUF4845 domain-containing protein [Burkholderiaceae bacterium]|jgi:type II secretory pathway pseudopilin PulG
MIQSRRLSRQRGASLITLLVVAIIVGFFMLMAARLFPSVNEYVTIRKAVSHIMAGSPGSADEIRKSFDRTSEVEYSIHTLAGKDLNIQVIGDSGSIRTSYAYNVEVPIVEPVYILIKYSGTATSGGSKGP